MKHLKVETRVPLPQFKLPTLQLPAMASDYVWFLDGFFTGIKSPTVADISHIPEEEVRGRMLWMRGYSAAYQIHSEQRG